MAEDQPAPKRPRGGPEAAPLLGKVTLTVGSEKFVTSAATLRSVDCYFASLVSGRHAVALEEDGSIFVDRPPKHFPVILEYLQNAGKGFVPPEEAAERDELLLEAEFYGLTRMASALRRFRVQATHCMTVTENLRVKPDEKGWWGVHRGLVGGRRGAAALFEVEDPDHFDISFENPLNKVSVVEGRVGEWAEHFFREGGEGGQPALFIGVAPCDVDLSAPWVTGPNPFPQCNRAVQGRGGAVTWEPVDTVPVGSWSPQSGAGRISRAEAERFWPREVEFPPALQKGVFCVVTFCFFHADAAAAPAHEPPYDADSFIYQIIQHGNFQSERPKDPWKERPFERISLRFARSARRCTLEFLVEDDDTEQYHELLDLEKEGLDPAVPYRPVIFFGKKGQALFEDHCRQHAPDP